MKDEMGGMAIKRVVCLRAKLYAIEMGSQTVDVLRAKGIKRYAVQSKLRFEDYVKCLISGDSTVVEQHMIQSRLHKLSTISIKKVALSRNDTKRVIQNDRVTTLPYGHYALQDNPMIVDLTDGDDGSSSIEMVPLENENFQPEIEIHPSQLLQLTWLRDAFNDPFVTNTPLPMLTPLCGSHNSKRQCPCKLSGIIRHRLSIS